MTTAINATPLINGLNAALIRCRSALTKCMASRSPANELYYRGYRDALDDLSAVLRGIPPRDDNRFWPDNLHKFTLDAEKGANTNGD